MVRLALRLVFIMVFVNGFACDSQGVCYHNTEPYLQSTIGNVASGSLFAVAQSVGMTTVAGLAAPIAIGAAVGGVAYLIYEGVKCFSEGDNCPKGEANEATSP
jgi:hypothetical protein